MSTDLAIGPAFRFTLGSPRRPVTLSLVGRGGLALSQLLRSVDANTQETYDGVGGLLRGEVSVAIPLGRQHGIGFGVTVGQIFDPTSADVEVGGEERAEPFDLTLDAYLGYHGWF